VEEADIRRAIAKHADGHVVIAGVLISARPTAIGVPPTWHVAHVLLRVRHVHRTPLALRDAGGLPEQLSHDFIG
jgi:hypothetical protein